MKEQMPFTMELSRSFVAEGHQRTDSARKSIFVLDCLFKGICVAAREGGMTDVFGKVTFYPDYPQEAFSLLTSFMKKHCSGGKNEIAPISQYPVSLAIDAEKAKVAKRRIDDMEEPTPGDDSYGHYWLLKGEIAHLGGDITNAMDAAVKSLCFENKDVETFPDALMLSADCYERLGNFYCIFLVVFAVGHKDDNLRGIVAAGE